jgi:hypothetical protein
MVKIMAIAIDIPGISQKIRCTEQTPSGHRPGSISAEGIATCAICGVTYKANGEAVQPSALNSQVQGDHYKKLAEYQPWMVMSKWMSPEALKGYAIGTVCAYLCREDDKGGRNDIEKAMHTLQIYLELTNDHNRDI